MCNLLLISSFFPLKYLIKLAVKLCNGKHCIITGVPFALLNRIKMSWGGLR